MIEPEDYGLGPEETLARVGDPTRASLHKAFWTRHWKALIASPRPLLTEAKNADPSDPGVTHTFPGVRHIDIGCRLAMPQPPLRGVAILLHGYDSVPTLTERIESETALLERGLALLAIRARGFAGSRVDGIPPAGSPGSGWITHGLDAPGDDLAGAEAWVAPLAVADVIDAARAARNWLMDQGLPLGLIAIKGESLGATLAIDAVAALNGRLPRETIVDRLVIALPTLADWPWRLMTPPPTTGTGAEIDALLKRAPEPNRQTIIDRLRLLDPVVHAPHVRIPVLCKLAQRDDVAPAPAAAAAFNALSSDPGRRWRFVVPYGHFDGGIANARRHALFEKCAADFLDPDKRPRRSMRPWLDRLHYPPDSSENSP